MVLRFITSRFPPTVKRAAYLADGYCRLGGLHNDFYDKHPIIDEAIRRLSKKEQDERHFRILRAIQCDISHTLLPKEQWTPYEANHFYLDPLIDEVEAEEKEKKEWFKTH